MLQIEQSLFTPTEFPVQRELHRGEPTYLLWPRRIQFEFYAGRSRKKRYYNPAEHEYGWQAGDQGTPVLQRDVGGRFQPNTPAAPNFHWSSVLFEVQLAENQWWWIYFKLRGDRLDGEGDCVQGHIFRPRSGLELPQREYPGRAGSSIGSVSSAVWSVYDNAAAFQQIEHLVTKSSRIHGVFIWKPNVVIPLIDARSRRIINFYPVRDTDRYPVRCSPVRYLNRTNNHERSQVRQIARTIRQTPELVPQWQRRMLAQAERHKTGPATNMAKPGFSPSAFRNNYGRGGFHFSPSDGTKSLEEVWTRRTFPATLPPLP